MLHLFLTAGLVAACSTAPPEPERLPADLVRDGLLFVRGSIAGREAAMLLDTGAGTTLVAASFARRIGLRTEAGTTGIALGVGGRATAIRVDDVPLRLGKISMTTTVAVVPMDFAPVLGRDLEVVLGRDVFEAFVVELDYASDVVAFHDRESFRYRGPGVTMPLQRGELGAFYVAGEIEDHGAAWFELDTGDSGTLTLHAPYVRSRRFLDGRAQGTGLRAGVGGVVEVVTTNVERFTFGNAQFRDVPVDTDDVEDGMFTRTEAAGNLGTSVLSRCKVIVDGSRDEMHVEPIPERVGRPFTRNRTGLALAHRGTYLEVQHVASNSAAAAAGLAIGDRVRAIDDVAVAEDYWTTTWKWVHQPAGTSVSLELIDGSTRRIVLGHVP